MTVLVSKDEIDLQRLLLACERKQKQQQSGVVVPESEKSRFVAVRNAKDANVHRH